MSLLDLIYPPQCISCSQLLDVPSGFCDTCANQTEAVEAFCRRCGEPEHFPESLCPRCRQRSPPFVRAFAPFLHEGAIARAIHLFKYEDRPDLAFTLARWAVDASSQFLAHAPANVCAIPLHRRRFWQRRYDQGQLLAREVARLAGRTYLPRVLVRTHRTRRQVGLSEAEREANVKGAFAVSGAVTGLSILLVDDVLTTGATARSAAQALENAGAKEVWVYALARAHGGAISGKAKAPSDVVAPPCAP